MPLCEGVDFLLCAEIYTALFTYWQNPQISRHDRRFFSCTYESRRREGTPRLKAPAGIENGYLHSKVIVDSGDAM
jgi:hypothetical protein